MILNILLRSTRRLQSTNVHRNYMYMVRSPYQIATTSHDTNGQSALLKHVRMNHNPADRNNLEIKIKPKLTVRDVIKKATKEYGPVFLVVHITVSLMSVGFFYSIVNYTVNPIEYLPHIVTELLGEKLTLATNEGGTMVIAYALHKIVFPVRLAISLGTTPYLSKRIFQMRFFKDRKNGKA